MCGITGIFCPAGAPADEALLHRMTSLLTHRGPDGEGYWSEGPIALGHRRLSILDLSERGTNPMAANDTRIRITYNGELYNMSELRAALQAKGYVFQSQTDTEVVVNMYQEYGTAALEQFDGMFAFAIWDGRSGQLVLARDRFGVKPLFFTEIGGRVLFASEIKAFLAEPRFQAVPDPIGVSQQLSFMGLLGDRTVFRNVNLLEPGQVMTFSAQSSTRRTYWSLSPSLRSDISDATWSDRIDTVFSASVLRQMQSDVPLSSYLSGGLDTSAVTSVALAQQTEMHTFTCGFQLPEGASGLEKYFDETLPSRETAELLGTSHHELLLGPEAMTSTIDKLAWHLEEPRAGISYQNFLTAGMVSRDHGLKVILSGVGGDELFGGYHWRIGAAAALPVEEFETTFYNHACRLLSDDRKNSILNDDFKEQIGDYTPRDDFNKLVGRSSHLPSGERALHFEFYSFLQSLLLVEDKLSMAHSLESRVPFLDNALVDLAFSIPLAQNLRQGQGKALLRAALARRLPAAVLNRRKQGFTPPDRTWYQTVHKDFLFDRLLSNSGVLGELFNLSAIETVLTEHVDGQKDHRFLIWSLLVYQSAFGAFRAHSL